MANWKIITADMRPAECPASDWLVLKSLARTGGVLTDAVADTGLPLAHVRMVSFRWRAVWQSAN